MNAPDKLPELRRQIAEIEDRKPLTRAQVIALVCRQATGPVMCGCGCGEPLDPLTEGVVDEHRVALQLTGSNALDNRELWRRPCSARKTAVRDRPAIAKAKRLAGETCNGPRKAIAKHVDPWGPKGTRKFPTGRPFPRKQQERGQ